MTPTSKFIDDPRFNRIYTLPADPDKGRHLPFQIQYADYGFRDQEHAGAEEDVLLFFGPMMASRLAHITADEVAKQHRVRVINPDRPGFGGTDALDLENRMSVWADAISALLQHLDTPHVSIACHSGGAVYAADLLLRHPYILRPEKPYLAFGAPWILPAHTDSTAMAVVQALPTSLIAQMDKIAKLINNHVGPMVGASAGAMSKLLPPRPPDPPTTLDDTSDRDQVAFADRAWPEVMNRIYLDGVRGMSAEAVLLMNRHAPRGRSGWSDWGDYDGLVPMLAEALRASGRRLAVETFFAERDAVIGDGGSRGPRWFDECWSAEAFRDVLDYQSRVVEGADHDSIWNLRWGAFQQMLRQIGTPKDNGISSGATP